MNIKKVIVLLVAALMGQVVVASDVDLYRGLLFWIKDQKNIEGNESRETTYPLSKVFDGSFANPLKGTAIAAKGSVAFSMAFSFKVGQVDCLNRMLRFGTYRHFYIDNDNKLCCAVLDGSGALLKSIKSTLTVSKDTWYSLLIRQGEDRHVYIYAGKKDTVLSCVADYGDTKIFGFDSANVGMGTIVFGTCNYPSAGNFQSGQFANIRFWTRALSDEECAMADKSQNIILETKPLGCPSDVKYDFFPLGGNMFGVDESSATPKCSSYNVTSSGWNVKQNRFGSECCAIGSSGTGRIVIDKFNTLFDGGYIVNGGKGELSDTAYGYSKYVTIKTGAGITDYKSDYFRYPVPTVANSKSDCDATYSFWVYINNYPLSGTVPLFSRTSAPVKDANNLVVNSNEMFLASVSADGMLVLSGSDIVTSSFSSLPRNEWSMISIVGRNKKTIQVFVNGKEVGIASCGYSLGYVPPVDQRQYRYAVDWYDLGEYWHHQYTKRFVNEITGSIVPISMTMEIGGWDGAIDEIQLYAKALSASEIKTLYEESAPPDPNTAITPTTRNFVTGGGGGAIITSGNASTWWARVTEPWITLSANSGNIGYPVAYTVSTTTNAEQRVGYVYVNGHAHEVTQDGLGGTIDSDGATYEKTGGSGSIAVGAQNGVAWKAISNVDWLSVSPTNGVGSGSLTYQVAAYDEVATRQGTLTIAGNTFTVFQYGRRMKIEPASMTKDYETHVIPITVNALAITQWSVTPNNSWISVVDGGNGQGGDLVTIAIAENPSYKARTGTVTIGIETFTVTQQGRPTEALSFNVSPTASTASVEGANGLVAITATPDLPWTATSGANWLTVYAATATGAGNGNVVYSASPNPTLLERTGTITVTPEAASGMSAKTHTVTQPAATAALSSSGYEFEASGESCSVEVSVAGIVQWDISESLDWITVNGSASRTGPGTVVIQASANNTVYPRSGKVTIAGKTFSVSQKARGVNLEYDTKLFGTDGGYESISIHPDGNSAWTAVASDATWITIFQGDSGTGDGEILYIVSPYVGDGSVRTGWITVGDKKVYITQRAYDLAIEPNGTNVVGNAGAGEFGVSASIGDVWTAIVTEPWITLVSGYDSGTGNGTVRFVYTENTTGKTRTGKIIVSGEVYTLEQRARTMVAITATAEHGGHVSGGGSYDLGASVMLTAVPDSGYAFSYWTGAIESMQNPLTVTADVAKSYTAVFEPLPIAFTAVESSTEGVSLSWNNLAWAGTYRIYRGVTSVPSSATVLVELPNNGNCTYLDESGDVDVEYWYWIEAEGPSDEVMSDPMTGRKERPIVYSPITYENLRGATNPNSATYQEGTLVSFQNPGTVTGYTFAGWTPSQITADMTGAQTVRAAWTANSYSIAYNPNGGSGTMAATAMTYDSEGVVASNGFTRIGYNFIGWATEPNGAVVYAEGQMIRNLTTQSSGVVMLYAVWEEIPGPRFYVDGNGVLTGADLNGVTDIVIPDGVTCIGDWFFSYKTELVSVALPGTVTNIGTAAFFQSGLTNLTTISSNVLSIGNAAFSGCTGLMSFDVAVENPSYMGINGLLLTKDGKRIISAAGGLRSVVIPSSVTIIGNGAFECCDNITSITIPDTVESIAGVAFMGCTSLTSVTIGSGVTNISTWAFDSCKAMTNLIVRSGTTKIGGGAFANCDSLINLMIADGVTNIEWNVKILSLQKISLPQTLKGVVTSENVSELFGCSSDVTIIYRGNVETPVIAPADGATFIGESCTVTITCATEGASIHYTTDGSTPRPSKKFLYTGPFTITDTAEICAFAVLDDESSGYVTATITKSAPVPLTLARAIDVPTRPVTTGGDAGWTPVDDVTAVDGHSARSGAISLEESTWMAMSVSGAGTLTFSWKADCEKDPRNRYSYDYGAFEVDGVVTNRIDGTTVWQTVTVGVADDGTHTFRWTYSKDDYDEDSYNGDDCVWIDNVVWTPSAAPAWVDVGEKGAVEASGNGYAVVAKEGETLTEADFMFGIAAKEAYVVSIAADGKSATVTLKAPEVAAREAGQGSQPSQVEEGVGDDTEDPVGILASVEDIVAKHGESAIKAKPTPKSGEEVGALPVKAYEGLYYQAAWGDDLGAMTQGEKVQATGDTLYLGVIKQTGNKGFYRITVSEQ